MQKASFTAIYFISKNLTYQMDIQAPGDTTRKLIIVSLVYIILASIATSIAAQEVTVSGSTTVGPLGILCSEAFNEAQTDYHVSVTQSGTGAGVTDIGEGRADIAMASREITPDEKKKYGDRFRENLIGYDGIAICVSKPIYDAGIIALTKEQVKKIYAGEIKNWMELNGPVEEIYVISREQGSGTRDTFLEDIFGDKKAETPGVATYSSSNAEIHKAITGSNKAIGYLGYSYSKGEGLKAVKLEGIELTPETAKNKSYSLARELYLDTLGDPIPGAKAFIDFCKGPEGQKIAEDNGYIPVLSSNIPTAVKTNQPSGKENSEIPEKKQPGFELAFSLAALLSISFTLIRKKE